MTLNNSCVHNQFFFCCRSSSLLLLSQISAIITVQNYFDLVFATVIFKAFQMMQIKFDLSVP